MPNKETGKKFAKFKKLISKFGFFQERNFLMFDYVQIKLQFSLLSNLKMKIYINISTNWNNCLKINIKMKLKQKKTSANNLNAKIVIFENAKYVDIMKC